MAEVSFEPHNNVLHFQRRNAYDELIETTTGGKMLAQNDYMVDESGNRMVYESPITVRPIVVTFEPRDMNLTFKRE